MRMGCALLPPDVPLWALWQNRSCYGLRAAIPLSLLSKGLPTWGLGQPYYSGAPAVQPDSGPSRSPPWPSCYGRQPAEGLRGAVLITPPSSSLQSGSCTHQHPFGTFSYHGSSRLGGPWSPGPRSQALLPAPFRPQTSRAVEKAESGVGTWPRKGRASQVGWSELSNR